MLPIFQSTSCPVCVSKFGRTFVFGPFRCRRVGILHFAGISTIVIDWKARMLRYWLVMLSQELGSGEDTEVLVVLDGRGARLVGVLGIRISVSRRPCNIQQLLHLNDIRNNPNTPLGNPHTDRNCSCRPSAMYLVL